MPKILVLYGTKYGHTAKIAGVLEHELKQLGDTVTVKNITEKEKPHLDEFDGVIIGAPVYAGQFQKAVRSWVKQNAPLLSPKPSALLSVCLGILEKNNVASQDQEKRIVRDFSESSGWRPDLTRIIPGALPYTRYNWIIRLLMKRIATKAGGDSDTSRDYDYTDWDEVRRFAREFSALLSNQSQSPHALKSQGSK